MQDSRCCFPSYRAGVPEPYVTVADKGQIDAIELLLSRVTVKTRRGSTALHLVANRGHKDVVELLLSRGVDIIVKTGVEWIAIRGNS